MTTPLPPLILYGRPGCHLCDEAHTTLEALLADRAAHGLATPELEVHNIETDDDWQRRYALTIPVVTLGDRQLELATSPARLRRLLADVLDAPATSGTTGTPA